MRAGLATGAEDYQWSSAAGHTGRRVDALLSDRQGLLADIENCSDWLKADDETETVTRLKLYTRTGRPLGNETFTQSIELNTGRELRPKPHGRPRRCRG